MCTMTTMHELQKNLFKTFYLLLLEGQIRLLRGDKDFPSASLLPKWEQELS